MKSIIRSHIASSHKWLKRVKTRKSCDDAYADLMLATVDYGFARGASGLRVSGPLHKLEQELLAVSHDLRPRCRNMLKK